MAAQRPRAPAGAPAIGDLFAPRPAAGELLARDRERDLAPSPEREPEPTTDDEASAEPAPAGPRAPVYVAAPARRLTSPPGFGGEISPRREFEYNGGIHLTDSVLWCDADRKNDLSFISHAHVDAIGKNRRMLATDKTLKIATRASGKIDALASPYRRAFQLGPLELELHPAGHVLGSAQLLVIRDGRRLVYTSDVNPRPSETAERARAVPCDVLVVPATYGVPLYKFPPREEVVAELKAFVDRCLEDHATPVLIANQIGTAQELMRILGDAGYRLRVHRSIYDVAKIYGELGVNLPGARRFAGTPARDEVVLFPPILRKHASIRKLRKSQTAWVSGRAVEPGFTFTHKVDKAFALSDSADHDDLVAFITETGAKEVYLSSGHIDELGAELRQKGLRVYSLVKPEQLTLF